MYTYSTSLRLRDTDAAGVIYFPHVFDLAHEALESYLDSVGMDIGQLLRTASFDLPVVHGDADLLKPILPGHKLTITMALDRIGESSFTLRYQIDETGGPALAKVRITHVMVDRQSHQSMALTETMRGALAPLAG